MQQFKGVSLRTRLYILVLAALIPVSGVIFFIAEEQKSEETKAILQKTMALTKAAAIEESQKLASTRALLSTVSDMFLMFDGNAGEMSGLLSILLRQSVEKYEQLGIINLDGRLLAGNDPSGGNRDYSNRSWFFTCLKTKELTMGEYRGERIDGEPVLFFALPVLDQHQQAAAIVFAAVNLNWMNRTVFDRLLELPSGARLILMDQAGEMLEYDVDSAKWSASAGFGQELEQHIFTHESGTLMSSDENNISRIYAFASLTSSFGGRRVSAVLGIPEAYALRASKYNFTRNVTLLISSAVMAVLLIWWAGNVYILKRVQRIVRASRELAAGNLGTRVGGTGIHDELDHLASVFDEMAASLQQRITHEEQVMASLEQSREQIRGLSAHQQDVREQERIRIAREIHDQFGQSLTVLKMDLFWLKKRLSKENGNVSEKLEGMSRIIDESLEDLHAITAELRPVILDDFGLAAAIEWQCNDFQNRSGITCRMEMPETEPDLPKDQTAALFRIFQETLTNVARHAGASFVKVCLGVEKNDLLLQVQDNGRGITDTDISNPKSFGLLGIRERLYPWDGRVLFEGMPGQGTCVTVRLPLHPKGVSQ